MNIEQLSKTDTEEALPSDLMGKRFDHTPAKEWAVVCSYIADSLKQYDKDNWEDSITEISSGLIPVYYREQWDEMNSLSLWAEDDIEEEANELMEGYDYDSTDSPIWRVVNAYLFIFYRKATQIVIDYLNEQEEGEE